VVTLHTIKKRGGYTQTMHYTSGKLSSVTDSYSRSLGISYSSVGLLAGVTTPDTLAMTYGYVAYSSAHLLTSVSYNTSPATSQTYLYENTSYPFALIGITDENGNRYATWAYDGSGRRHQASMPVARIIRKSPIPRQATAPSPGRSALSRRINSRRCKASRK
jgi:uncharacterized protein RhaS with RHS repeats